MDPHKVSLRDVCRFCLVKTDNMKNLSLKNDINTEIIAMLKSIGNIEIEITDYLPSYLCKNCEEKLRLSYDFQMLIQSSNDFLLAMSEESKLVLQAEVEEIINALQQQFYLNVKCIKCGFVSSNSRSLSLHMTHLHKEVKDSWCSACNLEVVNLPEHQLTHNQDPFKCKFCEKSFNSRSHFYDHLRTHSNTKTYNCHLCERSFTTESQLRRHYKSHSERTTKPVTTKLFEGLLCMKCGKKFNSYARYQLHMRTHTREAPYKCQYCDKRTISRNHLKLHERTHTGEKPHICNICNKGFAQSSVLHTHMKIHTGRPEVCHICKKRFCRPAQLRLHMRKHTGEKPYKCEFCEQAFKQQSHLTEHVRRHSNERPYKCPHCDKSFKQISVLKSHVTIHTGERPFKCSQCSYACRQGYSLTQHMKQHSVDTPDPKKPHICEMCQKGYSTMAMLMSHTNLVHIKK